MCISVETHLIRKEVRMSHSEDYKVLYRFFIAGVQYHDINSVIKHLKEETRLQLVAEPTNKYDPNAVRIEYVGDKKDTMLGYVPRQISSEISAAIELGKSLECVITHINPKARPWEKCKVEIRELQAGGQV